MTTCCSSVFGRFVVFSVLAVISPAPAAALLTVVETLRDIPITTPSALVASGDDRFLYALGDGTTLAVFERDPATGLVSFVKAYREGYDGVTGLAGAYTMVISPDDRFLYVSSPQVLGADGVARRGVGIFERDPGDGTVRSLGVYTAGFDGHGEIGGMTLSSDGVHLYVVSAHAVLVFTRDPADGRLSFSGAISEGIDETAYSLLGGLDPEGRFLYVTQWQYETTPDGYEPGRLLVYARDAATGVLTFVEKHVNHRRGIADMDRPAAVVASPDGAYVYVLNTSLFPYDDGDGAIVAFRRDPSSGRLASMGTQDYLDVRPGQALFNADGSVLYVAGFDAYATNSAVKIYARGATSGTLERIGTVREKRPYAPPLLAMAFSGDHRHLYTGSFEGRLLAAWEIEAGGLLRALRDAHDASDGRGALRGADRAAVSPDGRHVYVTSPGSGGLAIFERDQETGRLAFIDRIGDDWWNGPLAVSADGRWVYALDSVFARRAESGRLRRIPQLDPYLSFTGDVLPSPDGRHLYVVQQHDWHRPIVGYEQTAGGLLQPFEITIPPVPGRGSFSSVSAAMSPDGAYLFAVGDFSGEPGRPGIDALCAFARDAASGGLTLESVAKLGPVTFDKPRLAVAPNSRDVYLVEPAAGELRAYRHDRRAKRLRFIERHVHGLDGVDGLDEPSDVAVSPSGRLVYVAGTASEAVAVFARDPESGSLTFQDAVRGGPGLDGLILPHGLAVAPDNRHVYVTSPRLSALTALTLDCPGGPAVLCLDSDRFRVDVQWHDGRGHGEGRVVPLRSSNSGLFWFFSADNWEMLVKVLDGCAINKRFWVFAAATTNVGYDLRVTDTWSGEVKSYTNPLGTASRAITDTGALHGCGVQRSLPSAPSVEEVSAADLPAAVDLPLPSKQEGCMPEPSLLCLNRNRFRVEVEWRDGRGQEGRARVVSSALVDDSGLLWFFSPDNWEMLVKVLDGCAINDHYWVFAAATTAAGYTLRVTDSESGTIKEWVNPVGVASPSITDTGAFATCP